MVRQPIKGRKKYSSRGKTRRTYQRSSRTAKHYSARSRYRATNPRTGGYIGMELKRLDNHLIDTTLPSSIGPGNLDPTEFCLNPVPQGDGDNERNGRKYTMKEVQVNGIIQSNAVVGAAGPPSAVHGWVALVLDMQTNGAQLNPADVYVANSATTTDAPFRNLEHITRFKVLKHQTFTFERRFTQEGTGVGALFNYGADKESFHWRVPLDVPVICNGASAIIGNITDNSLHVIGCAVPSTGSSICTLKYNSRVRFVG